MKKGEKKKEEKAVPVVCVREKALQCKTQREIYAVVF